MEPAAPPPPAPGQVPADKGEGCGCVAKGCLILAVLGLLFAFLIGWGMYSTYQNLYALTADGPAPLPSFEPDPDHFARLEQELESFQQAADQGEPFTLRLTAQDLNTLVTTWWRQMGMDEGGFFFAIEDNLLSVQASVPLTWVPAFHGRWFNGEVVLGLQVEDGELTFLPEIIKVGDLQAPQQTVDALRAYRWNDALDPDQQAALRKVKSARIEDDTLILETQAGPPGDQ